MHTYKTSESGYTMRGIVDNLCEYALNYTYLYIHLYTYARISFYANMFWTTHIYIHISIHIVHIYTHKNAILLWFERQRAWEIHAHCRRPRSLRRDIWIYPSSWGVDWTPWGTQARCTDQSFACVDKWVRHTLFRVKHTCRHTPDSIFPSMIPYEIGSGFDCVFFFAEGVDLKGEVGCVDFLRRVWICCGAYFWGISCIYTMHFFHFDFCSDAFFNLKSTKYSIRIAMLFTVLFAVVFAVLSVAYSQRLCKRYKSHRTKRWARFSNW